MIEINKKAYETPTLTVVMFKSEQGYAASGEIEALRLRLEEGFNEGPYEPMESYSIQENWNSGGDFWN